MPQRTYCARDDLAQSHPPVNACERMVLTAAAHSWLALQPARELERRIFDQTWLFDLVSETAPTQPCATVWGLTRKLDQVVG